MYLFGRVPSDAFDILSMFHEHRDRLEITIWVHYKKSINPTGKERENREKIYPPISTPSYPDYSSPTTSQTPNTPHSYIPSRGPLVYSHIPIPTRIQDRHQLPRLPHHCYRAPAAPRAHAHNLLHAHAHAYVVSPPYPPAPISRYSNQTKQWRASARTVPTPPLSPFSHGRWEY